MRKLFIAAMIAVTALFAEEELPPVQTVTIKTVSVTIANVQLVKIVLPEIILTKTEIPEVVVADCGIPTPENIIDNNGIVDYVSYLAIADCGIKTPIDINSNLQVVFKSNIPIVHFQNTKQNMKEAAEFKKLISVFRDKRSILNDANAIPNSTIYKLWSDIYAKNKNYTPEYIAIPSKVRMIAEIHHPINQSTLTNNLTFYVNQGYNAVLITFDGTESPGELSSIAKQCRAVGLAPWFAYSGKESLSKSVLIAPAYLDRLIKDLAPHCDGMLLGWRRTSLHLFLPDREFTNYLIKKARSVNSKLCVIGESYLGHTAETLNPYTVTTNVPQNASGCLLVNVGFKNVTTNVLKTIFGKIESPKLVLVVGDRPYYKTKERNNLNFDQNLKIKREIEQRFLNAGAIGTITIHGDGSNGIYDKNVTDNIAQTGRN